MARLVWKSSMARRTIVAGVSLLAEMSPRDWSRIQRSRQPMPAKVRAALEGRGLLAKFQQRPPYQQNDYLRWIARARRPETQHKRLEQMLDELERGGMYMKMKWNPKKLID